jgi:hypothetical protein
MQGIGCSGDPQTPEIFCQMQKTVSRTSVTEVHPQARPDSQ